MRLMWHIVLKDLVRLRWQLVAWLVILGAKYAIGCAVIWVGPFAGDTHKNFEIVLAALRASEVIVTFVLTALLVQGDALVGSRQFWVTRPIAGARLLGAKIFGVCLLLIVPPLVLALPWWWVCGFGGSLLAAAAAEMIAWQLLAVVPAFLVASLTDTLGRFLMWSVIVIWLAVMAPFYTQWAWTKWEGGRVEGLTASTTERMMVVSAAMLVVAALVVALQYLTRRWVRSVIVLTSGGLVAVGCGALWVRPFAAVRARRNVPPEWNAARAAGVKLEWVEVSADKGGAQSTAEGVYVRSRMRASGIPDGLWLTGGTGKASWRWRDGFEHGDDCWVYNYNTWSDRGKAARLLFGWGEPGKDEETERWKRDHPPRVRPQSSSAPLNYSVYTSMRVPGTTAERMRREPSRFRLETSFQLMQPQLLLETALHPGPWMTHGAYGVRLARVWPVAIDATHEDPSARHIAVIESGPALFTDLWYEFLRVFPALESRGRRSWSSGDGPSFAVNRKYGMGDIYTESRSASLRISSVELVARTWRVWVPKVVREGKWVLEHPDWFDEAKLVIMDGVPLARFTREVTVEDFQIRP